MGKYYDANKPFSIENWNNLIQDVNDILENPPEDTECKPIDPLDEVEDPHRWSVEDIEEVQDALIETCPDISFSTDLILWKQEIIDEIEEQLELAWCNCKDTDLISYETEKIIGALFEAAPSAAHSGGAIFQLGFSPICDKPYHTEFQYNSTYYAGEVKSQAADAISITANTIGCAARRAAVDYRNCWVELLEISGKIELYQRSVDMYTTLTQVAIDEYTECMALAKNPTEEAECDPIKERICSYGQEAHDSQEKVNEQVSDYTAEHPNLEINKTLSDTKAQECFALLLSMEASFPMDKNFTPEVIAFFENGKYAWDKLIVPTPGGDLPLPIYSTRPEKGNQVIPRARVGRRKVPTGYTGPAGYYYPVIPTTGVDEISLTPGGYPFICGHYASRLITDCAITYYSRPARHYCDQWEGNTCEGGTVDNCEWGDWQNMFCAGGFCDTPDGDNWTGYVEAVDRYDSWVTCAIRISGRQGEDYTENQEEFHNTYLNWFTENEPYDERHEAYC